MRFSPAIAALAVATLLWSSGYVLTSWALEGASPAVVSVARFGIATLALLPFAVRRGLFVAVRRPRNLLLGATGVTIYYSFANLSLLFTTAGTASLIAAILPVLTVLGARIFLGEALSLRIVAGLLLATVGVAGVAITSWSIGPGVILNLVAVAGYAAYTLILRHGHDASADDPVALAGATGFWGVIFMLPWLGWEIITESAVLEPVAVMPLAVLALVVTGPTLLLYTYAAERLPAMLTGIAAAAIPPLGYLFALLCGEPLNMTRAVGGLVALGGVMLVTMPTRLDRRARTQSD